MSQVFRVPDAALKELEEEQARLLRSVNAHLVTAEQAKKIYWDKLRSVISQAYVSTDGARTIPIAIQCAHCSKVTVVQSDVMRFKCACTPDVEQFTFQCRKIDLTVSGAESTLEARIAALTGVRVESE